MDAPPDKEDVGPYLEIAGMLGRIGVHAPRVLHINRADGFLLLTDLGSTTYLEALSEASTDGRSDASCIDALYEDAIVALLRIQARGGEFAPQLPPYDAKLLRAEVGLFPEWFLGRHLGIALDSARVSALAQAFDLLVESALAQPRVFVHRDYHSRNLMLCRGDNPGILDFQDAVHGPLTYDLVSLLRDCYLAWPQERVERWAERFHRGLLEAGVARVGDPQRFLRWFDLMGVQRHLKAIGIFARLWHRDGKSGYLADIPRTLGYVEQVAARDARLAPLHALIVEVVRPVLQAQDARAEA
jgi:N-acetylmuramate 1-kinase